MLEKAISILYDTTQAKEEFLRNIFHRKVDLINSFEDAIFDKFEPLEDEYYRIEEDNIIYKKLESYLLDRTPG